MVWRFPLVLPGQQVEKRMFPYRKPTAYVTLPCATDLACDNSLRSFVAKGMFEKSRFNTKGQLPDWGRLWATTQLKLHTICKVTFLIIIIIIFLTSLQRTFNKNILNEMSFYWKGNKTMKAIRSNTIAYSKLAHYKSEFYYYYHYYLYDSD